MGKINKAIKNAHTYLLGSRRGEIQGTLSDQVDLSTALGGKQDKSAMVTTLTGADNNHYPTAKAVSDAIGSAGGGDMVKSTYDPNNKNADAFDYDNFINTPTIPSTAADVNALPSSTKYGAELSLSMNPTTYVVTMELKDQDGNRLGQQQTIDLPLESVVVSGSFNSSTQKITLTLQGGSTVEFSVADLVSGLQTEITSTNKLNSDFVDDTNSTTHKFVTPTQISTWNNKQDALTLPATPTSGNAVVWGNNNKTLADAGGAPVLTTGNQSIVGTKTFTTSPVVPSKTSAASPSGATVIATEAQVAQKQDTLTPGANITIDPNTNTISANNTTYSSATSTTAGIVKLGNDTAITDTIAQPGTATGKTYPVQLNASGQMGVNVPWANTTYSAGTGINIDGNNQISNTGVTSVNGNTGAVTVPEYTAGTGIEIETEESDMKGPCASGFHVPTNTELENLRTIMTTTFGMGNMSFATYLKMPVSGYISSSGTIQGQGTMGNYWSCYMLNSGVSAKAITLYFGSDATDITSSWSDVGLPIRPFKNVSVTPDSTWTMIYDNQDGGGIYRDQTNGLISISGDGGITWMTIADKNLGATSTDVTSSDSYGNYYQRGNNYGFSDTPTTTSSTLVDASSYGPGNYYSSSTFIVGAGTNWDTSNNTNLRGGDTQGTTIEQGGTTIINTGVLSVNGQTGNVTIESGGIQNNTTGTTSTMSSIRVGTEAEYALITPVAGVEYHIY